MADRLPSRRRKGTTKALVPFGREHCPTCALPLSSTTSTMAALFRHGGHGANRTATTFYCVPCRYDGGSVVVETNPRKEAV